MSEKKVYKLQLVNDSINLLEAKAQTKNNLTKSKNMCNDLITTSKNICKNEDVKFKWMSYYQSNKMT